MAGKLDWSDYEELGEILYERMPEVDPLTVRFTDLKDWVCSLPEFGGNPETCNEKKLEAVQMAWVEAFQDAE